MAERRGPIDAPRDVVLVGAGERARAWLALLRQSGRLRPVAVVCRHEPTPAPDLPRHETLDMAMRLHPDAAFAVALPPRAAAATALALAAAGRAAVVEAPLCDAIGESDVAAGGDGVRVAHGWTTLAGARTVEAVLGRMRAGELHIEVAGLPEADDGDLGEVLVHAAALVRALLPDASPVSARQLDAGTLEAELSGTASNGEWIAHLHVRTRGRRLAVRIAGASQSALWSYDGERESVTAGDTALVPLHAAPAGAVRALAQLLPDAPRGDGLREAVQSLRLARGIRALLPVRLPLGERSFRQSASIARRRPAHLLERLGLRGDLTVENVPAPVVLSPPLPPEPFELWAFRAGVKPVAFLTVRPDDVASTAAWFGDAACVRRERRVQIDAQDRWTDRRDLGAARVELYIARDRALAERAAHLQADVDPTRATRELGALLGYPPCCVDAFARQDDRANNSRNRYCTYARTPAPEGTAWPWELNNLHTVIVPFYPCSYRCERALQWARAVLAALAGAHPAAVESLRAALARPVLYFDHDHQLAFDGEWTDHAIAYRAVALTQPASPPFAALAAAIGRGDRLMFDDGCLRVEARGQTMLRLERTDPGLGFIAPFGDR